MATCSFKSCNNYTSKRRPNPGISYHGFPTDIVMKHKWTRIVQEERSEDDWKPSKSSKICSKHFKEEDTKMSYNSRFLKKRALPVIPPISTVKRKITEDFELLESEDEDILNTTYIEIKQEDLEDIEASIPIPTYLILKKNDQHKSSVANPSSASSSQTNIACGSPTREAHIETSTEDVTAMIEEEPGSPLSDVSIHSDASDSPEHKKIKNTLRKKMGMLKEYEEVLKMKCEEASILENKHEELLADIKYLQNMFKKKCKSELN